MHNTETHTHMHTTYADAKCEAQFLRNAECCPGTGKDSHSLQRKSSALPRKVRHSPHRTSRKALHTSVKAFCPHSVTPRAATAQMRISTISASGLVMLCDVWSAFCSSEVSVVAAEIS